MGTEIVMPALEMAQTTGTLIRWLKAEGDMVRKGDPLMEVETDKVTVEVEASGTGTLSGVMAHEGDVIPVGQVIAYLLAEGETRPTRPVAQSSPATQAPAHSAPPQATPSPAAQPSPTALPVPASPLARRVAAEHNVDLSQVKSATGRIEKDDVMAYLKTLEVANAVAASAPGTGKILASPMARRLAAEHNIDLAALAGKGFGPDGAVLAENVLAAVNGAGRVIGAGLGLQAQAMAAVTPPPAASEAGYSVMALSSVRKVIGDRLQASYQTAPHISLTLSVDMSEALRAMDRLKTAVQTGSGHTLTITALLARAVGTALVRHPKLNAHLAGDEIRQWAAVHLGIAVALDDGLIVPVIRNIESKGLAAIQAELRDLSDRARSGKLKPAEVKGSTFTVSNLGMFGIEQFTSILNPPEVAILSVGAIQETAVGVNGQLVLRPMLRLTLNVDHRVVDGAVGALFLKDLKALLEDPYLLLV